MLEEMAMTKVDVSGLRSQVSGLRSQVSGAQAGMLTDKVEVRSVWDVAYPEPVKEDC